jgi:hypothetical protein
LGGTQSALLAQRWPQRLPLHRLGVQSRLLAWQAPASHRPMLYWVASQRSGAQIDPSG